MTVAESGGGGITAMVGAPANTEYGSEVAESSGTARMASFLAVWLSRFFAMRVILSGLEGACNRQTVVGVGRRSSPAMPRPLVTAARERADRACSRVGYGRPMVWSRYPTIA